MKKYLFLSFYEFLLCLFYVLLLIVGKNEIFASFSYEVDKVEYIKRETANDNDNCTGLDFSKVLSDEKVFFGFYDPLKPLENNSSVIKFIKDTRINYLNYIVDIKSLATNDAVQQELNDLRSNFSSKKLRILLSIKSLDLWDTTNLKNLNLTIEKYSLDGVNIIYSCDTDLKTALSYINNTDNWNKSWITTFTVNAEIPLNNISNIQDYVNYTIIQAFYLDPDNNYSAPQGSNSNNTVTFNSLFEQLNKELKGNFTKLIWGFDLSGIMKTDPGSITGLIKKNSDACLNSDFYIWPWKEIRNTALMDMCIAKNGWSRNFDANTSSTILSNSNVSFAYEDLESLYNKFKWVTSNNFAGISIANLTFDSINYSILKFIKSGKDGSDDNRNNSKSDNSNSNNENNNKVIIGVVVGIILFVLVLLIGFFYCSRRRKRNSAIEFRSIEKHHYLDQPVTPPPPTPSPTPQQNSIVPTNGIYVSAFYDFEGKEENEISFRKGDLIEVIEKGDGPNSWWKGKINGIVGDFPGNYVNPA